jgi:dTMP kinase
MSGLFITFEGGEGSGKTTQIALLAEVFYQAGLPFRVLREPGGTAVGEAARSVLLDTSNTSMSPRAELLLYEAARAQLVEEVIRPALAAGEIVLCDRYTDSTIAYQGCARGLDLDEIAALNEIATGGLAPDRTLVFDIDPATGLARATGSAAGADRLESEELAFHERVCEGFLAIALASRQRVRVIDGSAEPDRVAAAVAHALSDLPGLSTVLGGSS